MAEISFKDHSPNTESLCSTLHKLHDYNATVFANVLNQTATADMWQLMWFSLTTGWLIGHSVLLNIIIFSLCNHDLCRSCTLLILAVECWCLYISFLYSTACILSDCTCVCSLELAVVTKKGCVNLQCFTVFQPPKTSNCQSWFPRVMKSWSVAKENLTCAVLIEKQSQLDCCWRTDSGVILLSNSGHVNNVNTK